MTKSYWQNGDVTDAFQLSAEVKGTLMIERYERPTKVNEKLEEFIDLGRTESVYRVFLGGQIVADGLAMPRDVGYLLRGIIVGQAGI